MGLSIKEKLEAKLRERAEKNSGNSNTTTPSATVEVSSSETLQTTSKSG